MSVKLTKAQAAQLLAQTPDTAPQSIAVTLPYPPSSNRYWRHFKGRTVRSAEATAYIRAVQSRLIVQGITDPIPTPVAVTYRVFRPIKSGDLMNREKVLSDALQGLAIVNDSQIHEGHMYLGDDKGNPRVEVEIRRLTPAAAPRE